MVYAASELATAPVASRKTPAPWSQHFELLSQHQLPSSHCVARGNTPVSSSVIHNVRGSRHYVAERGQLTV